MDFITNYLIQSNVLLLMLPIIATIIAFSRQVIGIKGFGIYIPLLLTFAFLLLGLKYSIVIFITILLIGTLFRLLLKNLRLLYLPRMAIILTLVTLIILLSLSILGYYKRIYFRDILSIIIMIALLEKFINAQIERDKRHAFILTLETVVLSIVCYYIASWLWLQNIVIHYPLWIILATVIINIFLGKWTGLRLSEYFRFREVIRHIELPQKK